MTVGGPNHQTKADAQTVSHPDRTVYVRAVATKDVLAEIEDDPELGLVAADVDTLYAVHASDGVRLALVSDRETAFAAARMHDMAPVSVH